LPTVGASPLIATAAPSEAADVEVRCGILLGSIEAPREDNAWKKSAPRISAAVHAKDLELRAKTAAQAIEILLIEGFRCGLSAPDLQRRCHARSLQPGRKQDQC
jgi:hypothetical protein